MDSARSENIIKRAPVQPATAPPLVVDLDGTLVRTDTLIEGVLAFFRTSPLGLIRLPGWLACGRAAFKQRIAARVSLDPERLPFNQPLLNYLREQHAHGRRIILATAATESIARSIADHVGLFSQTLSSSGEHNFKGQLKLRGIQEHVGQRFSYAGNSRADLPIWAAAETVLIVGTSPSVARRAAQMRNVEWQQPKLAFQARTWLRQLRVHQWLKNLLLFVPLLTSFSFGDMARTANAVLAFLAFSLAASATYVANDLWDLDNDRSHPRKRERPLASGAIQIQHATLAAAVLMAIALTIAVYIGTAFTSTLVAYVVLTSAYSWYLKRLVLLDVLVLALLFTLRIMAGAAAISVATSAWLLAFSVFLFFSLAMVKRCSELVVMQQQRREATMGRDYRVSDLAVLWPLGAASGVASVVVLGLFINSQEVQKHYPTPMFLWLVGAALLYWIGRLWIKTARGEMHDDPLVYAATDRTSLLALGAMIVTIMMAHFVQLD